jgi:peptidoglycan/LPS O-acetylase OafA/YrhL
LRHELLFYGLFLILILNLRVGLLLFACWFAAILYCFVRDGWMDDLSRPPLQTVTSPINFCFFVGMAIAVLGRANKLLLERFKAPSVSLWFGAISYPLYLCHLTVYFILGGLFKRLGLEPAWPWRMACVVAASLAVATLISRIYEQPLLQNLRRLGADSGLGRRSSAKT